MRTWFADTYYFIAMLNVRDAHHARVMQFNLGTRRRLLTTAWVLTEVADALSQPPDRGLFLSLNQLVNTSKIITSIPATQELYELGVSLYASRLDKAWSLTDCISFVVMRDHGIHEALTGDHHFEQAGFAALLR